MVKAALASFKPSDMAFLITQTLVVGMRACADLADNARARRDEPAVSAALSAAGDLASWADGQAVPPLADHPFLAQIPADRATWDAERTRLAGTSDPVTWSTAPGPGKTSARLTPLGTPGGGPPKHSSAPASPDPRPRHCAPPPQQPPVTNLSSARSAHSPSAPGFPCPPPGAVPSSEQVPDQRAPYRLTDRELAVLRLLAAGRANAQIGAELYISPKTASVHVTSILRKLGVTSRVQAAARAERAGMIGGQEP